MDEKDFLELIIMERMGMHHERFAEEYPLTEQQAAEAEKAYQIHELLYGQLNRAQIEMLELCEDAASSDVARENEYYYRAGFRDGVSLDRLVKEFKEGK